MLTTAPHIEESEESLPPIGETTLPETAVEEEDTGGGETLEPADPVQIRIETRPLTVDLFIKRIRSGEIYLAPDFHREAGLWNPREQSRFIESFLIRIPIPAFYMDATDEERWLVVDGLQRLTVLKRFVIEEAFALEQLEFLRQYEGHRFSDLPRSMQRRIEETQVVVYLIQPGTAPEVKYRIFRRINTGGMSLLPQEIRHILNQGPAAEMLKDLAATEEFRRATAGGIRDRRMSDREVVLRFLAFVMTPPDLYRESDLDGFLHRQMRALNEMTDGQRDELGRRFRRAMDIAHAVFGNDAFRKRYRAEDGRKPINKALFEAWSVNLDALSDPQAAALAERSDLVTAKFIQLMQERDFDAAVTQGTGDVNKVRRRFTGIAELIREVLA